MAKAIDWERRIGRRLRLRDLHVFFAVAECGSMAQAGTRLRVTQPAVSKAVGDLEAALGVRLLDRSPQGVTPTVYGQALLKCGVAVFDELRQGIRNIEHLADPAAGELRIGCQQSLAATIVAPVIERLSDKFPRIDFQVDQLISPTFEFPALHSRSIDLALTFLPGPTVGSGLGADLNVEILCDDGMCVGAGIQSRWAHRRRIELSELSDEPWLLGPPGSWTRAFVDEAFRAKGLAAPKTKVASYSAALLLALAPTGKYIYVTSGFTLRLLGNRLGIKALPIDLPVWPWPVAIVTLKNRTLSPVVERFVEHIREFTEPMRRGPPTSR
jgi:DNA-binding transcriptional LysR family regulator